MEIEEAAQKVLHHVPLPSTKTTNLVNTIESYIDPNIAAPRAVITVEANGIWNIWEKAVKHLMPADPVANKLDKERKNSHMPRVSSVKKVGPKTDVELRFYKYREFAAHIDAQKEELHELRLKDKSGKKRGLERAK